MPSPVDPRSDGGTLRSKLTNLILDLVFPPRCAGCDRLGYWFCPRCQAEIQPVDTTSSIARRANSSLTGLLAIGYFDGKWRKAIHAFKYAGRQVLAHTLAQIMDRYLQNHPLPGEVIVPVPLHQQRWRERGYNQSALLARELAILQGREVDTSTLVRQKATRPQVGMSEEERFRNVEDAFILSGDDLLGKNVLLIDDVATTGATLEACTQALRRGGVGAVWALVLAKER